MKLQCRKSTIFNICLWSLLGIAGFYLFVSVIIENQFELLYRILFGLGLLVSTAFCGIMVWNLITIYRHYVVADDKTVTINYGLFRKKRIFPLSDIECVAYTRYNLIFYVKNQNPIKIDLYYIKPKDGNEFLSWLESNGVQAEITKKAKEDK